MHQSKFAVVLLAGIHSYPASKALQNYTFKIIALAEVIGQVSVFLVLNGIMACLLVMLHWRHNARRGPSSSRLSSVSSSRRPLEPTSPSSPSPPRKKTARTVSFSPQTKNAASSTNADAATCNGDEENVENGATVDSDLLDSDDDDDSDLLDSDDDDDSDLLDSDDDDDEESPLEFTPAEDFDEDLALIPIGMLKLFVLLID